jgi:dihydrofolate synthase / folylpolyglutamate synthase
VRVLEQALALGPELSFFETATLAAFLAFRESKVELAIVEVGIGGRLDATNVVPPPRASALTRIALDHQDRLGDTLEGIAKEKAGIAKKGAPLVLGPMTADVRGAIEDVAATAGASLVDAPPLAPDVAVGLEGAHQRANAAVAWQLAEVLGLDHTARVTGLANARWAGRLETLQTSAPFAGTWILDGAHNPDGVLALLEALARGPEPGAIVFGALADKSWPEMLDLLTRLPAPRIYVAPSGRAATPPEALAAHATGRIATSIEAGLDEARGVASGKPVVVCGSLYLVGEARSRLLGLASDPPVAL